MMEKHLADADIQQFVLEPAHCSADVAVHVQQCPLCQAKAETYSFLFTEIKQEPKPVFDFDLSAAVLQRIAAEKPSFSLNSLPGYGIMIAALAAIVIPVYLFRLKIILFFKTYILGIASGVSKMMIYLIIVTFLVLVIFQCIEMYKKYQRKIDDLNYY